MAHVVKAECNQSIVAPAKLSNEANNSAISYQSILPVLGCTKNSRAIKNSLQARQSNHCYLKTILRHRKGAAAMGPNVSHSTLTQDHPLVQEEP